MRIRLATPALLLVALIGCADSDGAATPPITGGIPPIIVGGGGDGDAGVLGDGGLLADGGLLPDGGVAITPPDCVAITPGGANDVQAAPLSLAFAPTFAFAAFADDQCASMNPLLQIAFTDGPCAVNPARGLWLRIFEANIGDVVTVGGPGLNTDSLVFIDFYDGLGNHWCNSGVGFVNSVVFDHLGTGTGDRISTSIFEVTSLLRCGGTGGPDEVSLSVPAGDIDVNLTASWNDTCFGP